MTSSHSTGTNGATKIPRVVLDQVSQTYTTDAGDHVLALTETSTTVEPGEFVCIVGPSGCGKSTLLKMIAGFLEPTTGQVLLDDTEVTDPGPDRGVVFQHANLYPWMTVRENVELAGRFQNEPKAQRRATAEHFLEMVNLTEFADQRPYELSGGMQQRAQIARVLAGSPEILLMDEPFGALDALTRETMQEELLRIWRRDRRTVFFITHSVDEAVLLGTRVWVMSARPGRILENLSVQIGDPADPTLDLGELRGNPRFHELREYIADAIYAAQGATTSHASTD
ncbi:ABC transporter ATP-binding protein [Corynebacterium sp. AOP40-9SA-29]|uniref:ABC transporter ATP-binding protein n=1 Tax=Corynebacterium sp. AOP40-9SA-29 TaxID=3457677 RepID=UPI00403325F6